MEDTKNYPNRTITWTLGLVCWLAYCLTANPVHAERIALPRGDVFRPLIADPKEPRTFVSSVSLDRETAGLDDIKTALVGLGTNFGLYRWPGRQEDEGWQVSVFAAAFSQFNLDAPSDDLINTDYLVGFPLTYKRGHFSMRLRLFHQSSHLGDELLLGPNPPTRINLSFEAVDLLFAYEGGGWRGYAGGGYAFSVDPDDLEKGSYQMGIDFHGRSGWHGGLDVRALEEQDYDTGTSFMIGYQFGGKGPTDRSISLRLMAYDGMAPFGQFFTEDISYVGAGVYFNF